MSTHQRPAADQPAPFALELTLRERAFMVDFLDIGPRMWVPADAAHGLNLRDVRHLQHRLLAESNAPLSSRELAFLADVVGGTGRDWWGELADRYGIDCLSLWERLKAAHIDQGLIEILSAGGEC